jgi:DNA-binding NarL/FixJ family response regulator
VAETEPAVPELRRRWNMSETRLSAEFRNGSTSKGGTLADLAIPGVGSVLALKNRREKARNPSEGERRARKAVLVMASPLAETRRRWIQQLREAFAIYAVTERAALEYVMANLKPDILLIDLTLPGLRRARDLPEIQQLSPSTKVLVLTDSLAEGEGARALRAGAKGYCPRALDPENVKKAVTAVQNSEIWAPRKLLPGLVAELLSLIESRHGRDPLKVDARLENLTARQRLVADLISKGACNKEIADRLNITERTVKAHLTEAFRTTGVSGRLQLALLFNGQKRATR